MTEKVTPMFSDHEVIRAAKVEQERMNKHQAEERRKVQSTIPESAMPCPRLELRWEPDGGYERQCNYNFVIPITKNDIRVGSPAQYGSELRFNMGWTTNRGGGQGHPLYPNGVIDVPFRDGSHAAWDSHSTGFPAFVVYQGQAQSILPIEPSSAPVDEPPLEEVRGGGRDWAHRAATHALEEAKKLIRRTSFKVRDLRDEHRVHSWPWLYFHSIYSGLTHEAADIKDCSFTGFGDWMQFRTGRIKVENIKRVCAECGEDIPDDITQACEHIFGEDARAFMDADQ